MSSGVKAVKGLCAQLVITKFIVSACLDSLNSSENYEIEPVSLELHSSAFLFPLVLVHLVVQI